MYVFAIWSLNGLQWSNENQLQLIFIWFFFQLVINFWVTKKVVKLALENPKTQVKNTAAEMRRPGEKQVAQPYLRSQKYQDRDNYDVPV